MFLITSFIPYTGNKKFLVLPPKCAVMTIACPFFTLHYLLSASSPSFLVDGPFGLVHCRLCRLNAFQEELLSYTPRHDSLKTKKSKNKFINSQK